MERSNSQRPVHLNVAQRSEEWHKLRAKIPMTGSRAPDALGLSYYKSPWTIYQLVTGQISEVKSGVNPAMDFGTRSKKMMRRLHGVY